MGAKKIKGVNRFIEEPLESLPLSDLTKIWIEENTNRIVAGLVIVGFAALLFWGFRYYREVREERARTDYAKIFVKWPAQEKADPKQWEALASELEKYVDSYRGSQPALDAQLDLTDAYFRMGRYEDAAKRAGILLEEAPAGQDVKTFARYQLALSYEALGNTDEAIGQWNGLKGANLPGLTREANWHLGMLYSRKQDFTAATERYEQALKDDGVYPGSAMIEEELAFVKAKSGAKPGNPAGEAPKADTKG